MGWVVFPFETFSDMLEQDDVATQGRQQSAKDNYVIRNWPHGFSKSIIYHIPPPPSAPIKTQQNSPADIKQTVPSSNVGN